MIFIHGFRFYNIYLSSVLTNGIVVIYLKRVECALEHLIVIIGSIFIGINVGLGGWCDVYAPVVDSPASGVSRYQ